MYVRTLGTDILDTTLSSFETNLGFDPLERLNAERARQSRLARIAEKVGAVVEGSIDQSLRELDIDPSEFYGTPENERIVKLRNAIQQDALVRSFGAINGLIPIMTFEGDGGDGTYSVGVGRCTLP